MFSIPSQMVDQILLPSALRFFFIGGVFSFMIGIGLIVHSERTFLLFETMNRWITWRRAMHALEASRDSWRFVQRYRNVIAFMLIAGAAFTTFRLITVVNTEAVAPAIAGALHFPNAFVSWILASVKWFFLVWCAIGILVGLMLGFAPATLMKIDKTSGRWISTRKMGKIVDVMHTGPDKVVASFPKTTGAIIAILSVIEVVLVGMQMR